MADLTPPTAEQCTANEPVRIDSSATGYACWYPQMGGYAGKAIAMVDPGGCIDVYVWHDGQFPFEGSCSQCRMPREPVKLHHCDAGQFVLFGRFLELLESTWVDPDAPVAGEQDQP